MLNLCLLNLLQFYLTEGDVGQPRGPSSVVKLASLNNYVKVTCYTGDLSNEYLARFKVGLLLFDLCFALNFYS
jgi:molybdopterin/thiamine biosynthesis adenylyltransferase